MFENTTGAIQNEDAIAGASKEPISGESLYEQYENGASIEELNELLRSSQEGQTEETYADEADDAADGAQSNDEQHLSSQPSEDLAESQKTTADNTGAKKFSQRDLDYIIGKKTGEQARKHTALLDDLAVVLGVDREKVVEAVRRQRYEMEANEKGIQDPELYARAQEAERENAELRMRADRDEASRQFLNDIESQRVELVKEIPDFDMSKAVDNERFVSILDSLYQNPATKKDAVRLAYNAVYFGEETKRIAQRERDKVISSVKSGQARTLEGAQLGQSGASPKINVSKMTDNQIAEMAERILNGEKISL